MDIDLLLFTADLGVKTAEDLGTQGEAPSHPQLLDWLAIELMDNGWKLKHNRIAVSSPIARAMIGREEGEVVAVKVPAGDRELEIVAVEYI